ncbi:hypothetical protein GOP47_0028227 [Adiantum capillus-veneris]|nr:hypothetical protein GOP47_0028227 [Adiantum capillus-veneris]
MDGFGSSAGGSPPLSPEAVMEELNMKLAELYAQKTFETILDKCYSKCVTKPSSSLSSSESGCVSKCSERYIEAISIISKEIMSRGLQ